MAKKRGGGGNLHAQNKGGKDSKQHASHGKHNKAFGLPSDAFGHGNAGYSMGSGGGPGPPQDGPMGGGPEGPMMGGPSQMQDNMDQC